MSKITLTSDIVKQQRELERSTKEAENLNKEIQTKKDQLAKEAKEVEELKKQVHQVTETN